MVNWREREAAVDRLVSKPAHAGETVRLSFLKNGTVDPDRQMVEIVAILATGGDDSTPIGDGVNKYRSRLSLGQAEVFIDRSTYDGPVPRQGDKLRANDRAGAPWFEIAAVSDRYSNLLVLTLGEA